jgi:hypothetical protein
MSYTSPAIDNQMDLSADLVEVRYSIKKKPSPAN